MIETLQRELQVRNKEIARLHHLLEVQARALEAAVERPALPAAVDHPPPILQGPRWQVIQPSHMPIHGGSGFYGGWGVNEQG